MGYYKDNKPDILDSWKEISSYLDKSEKTCRNWAQSLDLPVHRIGNSPKARVYAYKNELDNWLSDSDVSKIEENRQKKNNISQKALSIAVLLLIFIVSGYIIFKNRADPDISLIDPGSKPSLAVVNFENRSGDNNLDNWRDAFPELLTIDLSQSRYIKVLRSDEVYSIKKKLGILGSERYSSDDLKAIADKGGVKYILKGSYIKAGESFVITAMLIDVINGKTISSLSAKAETEKDIFPVIDEFTKEIKLELKLTDSQIKGDIDYNIEQITTSSPEALDYYKQGVLSLYAGKFRDSINLMEKAIGIDEEFAMAYRSIANSFGNIGYLKKKDDYLKKAYKFSHRLPERERSYIKGTLYSNSEKTIPEAIKIFKKMLKFNPEDRWAIGALSSIYGDIEDLDNAAKLREKLIGRKVFLVYPYYNLATIYQMMGRYDKALELFKFYISNFNEHNFIRIGMAEVLMFQGKLDLALLEIKKAIALDPDSWPIYVREGDIYLYKGDYVNSEKAYRKLLKFKEESVQTMSLFNISIVYLAQVRLKESEKLMREIISITENKKLYKYKRFIHEYLGYIYFISGEYKKSLDEINAAIKIAEKMNKPLWEKIGRFYRALILLETGTESEAGKAESELKIWVKNRANKNLIRWLYLFQGIKEKKTGNISNAIDYFNKAISLLTSESVFDTEPISIFLDQIAHAYMQSGNIEKSKEIFENITKLTHGRFHAYDVYIKSFYQLGKIHQIQNKKDEAIKNYTKFIELWKNCDPQFKPMVEDAERRVKGLEKNKLFSGVLKEGGGI